ncbi:MAG TPA: alpha/beta hydrolase [Phenylobacterium sp.]
MALLMAASSPATADPLSLPAFIQSIHPVKADARIAYGPGTSQWADLYLPKDPGPHPVVMLVHGGCYSASVPAESTSQIAADLAGHGVAVWNVEYRRLGEPGGGYPGTFQDIAAAADRLRLEAPARHLDLTRVVAVGHSAGASLALWAASRGKLPAQSPLRTQGPLRIPTVILLAGTGDLKASAGVIQLGCSNVPRINALVGSPSATRQDAFSDTSPRELLPLGVRTVSIVGVYDDNYPPYIDLAWRQAARASGDPAEAVVLPDVGHYDVVAVDVPTWAIVRERILGEIRALPGN